MGSIPDFHIRDILRLNPLPNVSTIANSWNYKEYMLAIFLDIEGAFNNDCGLEGYLSSWIISILNDRRIQAKLGNKISNKYINSRTPQGGVLSPLMVMGKTLIKLESNGVKVVAHAKDLVILVSDKFLPL